MIEWIVKKIQKIWDEAHREAIAEWIGRICKDNNLACNFNINVPCIKNGSHPRNLEVLPGDLVKIINDDDTGYIMYLSNFKMTFMKKEEQGEKK